MPDILLHPGFHKTGTSSIQHFLWRNRDRIATRAHLVMLRHLQPVTRLAHAFSRSGNPLVLIDMLDALQAAFADVPRDGKDVLISCEALSGHLPGWPGVSDYGAAPMIWSYVAGYLDEAFAADRVRTVVTTRAADAWFSSAWRHHLQGQRLTEDHDAFTARLTGAVDFGDILRHSDLKPRALSLEDATQHPLGPGGALLSAFGWDDLTGFVPVAPGNRGPDEQSAAKLLELNRSDLDDDALKTCKAPYASTGWQR